MRPAKNPKNPTEEEIRDAMRRSKASLEMEGIHVTPEDEKAVYAYATGQIPITDLMKVYPNKR